MRNYTSPRTEIIAVQLTSTLLTGSSNNKTATIVSAGKQIYAW